MPNILSGFLNAGLLPIGEDDEKLKLLENAAANLATQIKTTPLLAYRFAIVAVDDRIKATDPTIKQAGQVVLDEWQTLVNVVGANPIQVYRAVTLRALEIVASDKPALAYALPLIVQNEPTLNSTGKEREVIDGMLRQFHSNTIEELTGAWVNPVDLTLPKLSGKIRKPQVNKDELTAAFARAAGPNDKDGKPLNNPNPHWTNVGQAWSFEFASRASEGIFAAIQGACSGLPEELRAVMAETIKELVSSVERLAMRDAKSELLWIRTSMYSPSARKPYRELSATDMLVHAVLDTSRAVGWNAPPSVEFFLHDMVESLSNKKVKLSKVLAEIGPKIAALPEAQTIMNDPAAATGRRTWLELAARPNPTDSFDEQSGVQQNHEESTPDLAVRFYRELQIRKILSSN
jgi:hypothetical protein